MFQLVVVLAGGQRIHTQLFHRRDKQKGPASEKQRQIVSNERKRLVEWIKEASEEANEKGIEGAPMTDRWTNPMSGRPYVNVRLLAGS